MQSPKIVVAVDLAASTEAVLAGAAELARATGAELVLVHVALPEPDFVGYRAGPQSVRDALAEEFRDEHRRLEELAQRLSADGIAATPLLVRGPTVEKILAEAERVDARWIVVGTHGRGAVLEALLGSVSHDVLRKAARPVLVVPPWRER